MAIRIAGVSLGLVLLTPIAAQAATICGAPERLAFTGAVERGRTFARGLFGGAEFRLVPSDFGWTIWVGDTTRPDESYAAIVTPPYRGVSALHIDGWHFRNADNTGPDDVGPKNVNAPQEERAFSFVLGAAAYRVTKGALDVLLWPGGHGRDAVELAHTVHARAPRAEGTLRISALDLGNLVPGGRAWVERMVFSVELVFPSAAREPCGG